MAYNENASIMGMTPDAQDKVRRALKNSWPDIKESGRNLILMDIEDETWYVGVYVVKKQVEI